MRNEMKCDAIFLHETVKLEKNRKNPKQMSKICLQWLGHVLGMDQDHGIPKKLLDGLQLVKGSGEDPRQPAKGLSWQRWLTWV